MFIRAVWAAVLMAAFRMECQAQTLLATSAEPDAHRVSPDADAAGCRAVSEPVVIRKPGCVRVVADISIKDPAASAIVVYADGVTVGGEEFKPEEVCPDYALAKELLDPLVRQSHVAAVRQMSRLTPLLASCDRDAK